MTDWSSSIEVELDPTAYLFRARHRLRIQVAPGAHPRVVDPAGAAYDLVIHHGGASDPRVVLPAAPPMNLGGRPDITDGP